MIDLPPDTPVWIDGHGPATLGVGLTADVAQW